MSQKAGAKAPVLPGGTVAMPVPPRPPAKAARASALAKEWGPTSEQGAAHSRKPSSARDKSMELVPPSCAAPYPVLQIFCVGSGELRGGKLRVVSTQYRLLAGCRAVHDVVQAAQPDLKVAVAYRTPAVADTLFVFRVL